MNAQNDASNLNTIESDTVKTSTENLADNATNETREDYPKMIIDYKASKGVWTGDKT